MPNIEINVTPTLHIHGDEATHKEECADSNGTAGYLFYYRKRLDAAKHFYSKKLHILTNKVRNKERNE